MAEQPEPDALSVPDGYDGPRACRPHEFGAMLDLQNLALRTLDSPATAPRWPTMGADWPHVYHPGNLDNIRVITHDGLVVSAVAIAPTTVRTPRGRIEVGGINGFVTHPAHRRRGLGTAVLRDAHRLMHACGHHIGMLGTVSQNYYRRFGWELGMRQRSHELDRANITLLPPSPGVQITEDWRPHVAALSAMHAREPMGADRDEEYFALVAQSRADRLLVALHDDAPVAYVAERQRAVVEYGGDVAATLALLRRVLRDIDDLNASTTDRPPGESTVVTLEVVVPESDRGLAGLLLETGIPFAQSHHYMIRVVNLESLLRTLDLSEIEVTPSDGGWRLRYGGQTLEVSDCALVKLLFGPERFPDFAPELFPLDFFQWVLDRM